MSFLTAIDRAVARVERRLAGLFRRGELSVCADDLTYQMEGYSDEPNDGVEPMQQFGFLSRPPVGSEGLCAHLGGRGEDAILIATQSRDDLPGDCAVGEAILFGKAASAGQAQFRAQADGTAAIAAATGKFVEVGGNTDAMVLGTTIKATLSTLLPLADNPVCPEVATWCNALLTVLQDLPLSTKAKVG